MALFRTPLIALKIQVSHVKVSDDDSGQVKNVGVIFLKEGIWQTRNSFSRSQQGLLREGGEWACDIKAWR